MKNVIKFAAVGLGGFLAGVGLMKYKILKSFYKMVKGEYESK